MSDEHRVPARARLSRRLAERMAAAFGTWPSTEWLEWFDRRFGLYFITVSVLVGLKWRSAFDLNGYLGAARAVSAGESPYADTLKSGFEQWGTLDIYVSPPFLAHALAPVASLPSDVVFAGWTAVGLAALVGALRLIDPRSLAARVPRLVLGLAYVWSSVFLGQVNVLVLAGLLVALAAPRPWLAGFGLALAIVLRFTPLAFAVVLVVERRWSTLAWAGAFTGLAVLATNPVEWAAFPGILLGLAAVPTQDVIPQASLAYLAPLLRPIAAVAAGVAIARCLIRPSTARPLILATVVGMSIVLLPSNSWGHWYAFAIAGLLVWGDRELWSRRAFAGFLGLGFILYGWVSSVVGVLALGGATVAAMRSVPAREGGPEGAGTTGVERSGVVGILPEP